MVIYFINIRLRLLVESELYQKDRKKEVPLVECTQARFEQRTLCAQDSELFIFFIFNASFFSLDRFDHRGSRVHCPFWFLFWKTTLLCFLQGVAPTRQLSYPTNWDRIWEITISSTCTQSCESARKPDLIVIIKISSKRQVLCGSALFLPDARHTIQ